MRTIRRFNNLSESEIGSSAAIGNFDGVHLGHLQVIDAARRKAESNGTKTAVVTFEPHPRQFFAPRMPAFRLMSPTARARRLESVGVDLLFELPFGASLAGMSAEQFSREVLSDGLGLSFAAVGEDFRFGKGRSGDALQLRSHGDALGFGTCIVPIAGNCGQRWSSTNVRAALGEGRPADAAKILGHWHRIDGRVQHGEQRGKGLGFPTANLSLEGLHPPRFGVYSVLVDVLSGHHSGCYQGSASIGIRPTFGGANPNLEVYILDFDADIYGELISVALVAFQRPEIAFLNAKDLVEQMREDCRLSRQILEANA